MGAIATLSSATLTVDPGQEVTFSVAVRNAGVVVDQFMIDIVGEVSAFAVVEPAMVNLLPEQSATVTVRFAPPRSSEVLAGSWPFGVRVVSQQDPRGTTVEEGVLDILPFTELSAEVVPAKAEGSRRANFEVAIDNLGNHPVNVAISPTDPEDDLDFRLDHSALVIQPGTAAFVRMQVRPKKKFLRGQPQRRPFRVLATVTDRQPVMAEGTMVQRQLLPKWLLPALLALLALIGVVLALWFTVLKPAVNSAAREAAQQQNQQITDVAQQAKNDAGQAKADVGAAGQKADAAKANADTAMRAVGLDPVNPPPAAQAGGQPTPGTVLAVGTPTDFRIAANSAITSNTNQFNEFPFAGVDPAKTLVITDLILQNPRGNTGTLRILRIDANNVKTVLLEVGLANFRDLDQHWLQPLTFLPGEKIVLAVSCQNPVEQGSCTPAASFSGRLG